MTTKRIHSDPILEALFTSKARVDVLELLFLTSGQRHYLRQIAALTNQPVRAVQRELARLEHAGLLESHREGNRRYYQANRNTPIFADLRSLLAKTAGLGFKLQETFRELHPEVVIAFIFGSYARGTEGPVSDLDLMVVGDIRSRKLARVLQPVASQLGREVNPVVLTPTELRLRLAEGDAFIQEVLSEPKIFVIGGENELREIARTGTTEAAKPNRRGNPPTAATG